MQLHCTSVLCCLAQVVLPQVFDWFYSDFGGTPEELIVFLKYYLPRGMEILTMPPIG
jgi:hypothetical protein